MFKNIAKILFWTYERGSLQYDLMCLAILAFIFLTPAGVFDGSAFSEKTPSPPISQSDPQSEEEPKAFVPPVAEASQPKSKQQQELTSEIIGPADPSQPGRKKKKPDDR